MDFSLCGYFIKLDVLKNSTKDNILYINAVELD